MYGAQKQLIQNFRDRVLNTELEDLSEPEEPETITIIDPIEKEIK